MTHPSIPVLAHGIGGREDLPLPFEYAVVGAGLALILSFVLLGLLWHTPQLGRPDAGIPMPRLQAYLDARGTRWVLKVIGLLGFAYFVLAATAGRDLATNPVFGIVYVLLWVGMLPASILLGPFWRAVNPVRTLHGVITRLIGVRPELGIRELPARLGYWPAAIGLAAFVWLELIAPGDTLDAIRVWFGLYVLIHLICAALYGSGWFDRGDTFEVLSEAWGRLSPWGRRGPDRQLVFRGPLDSMASWPAAPGLAAVVIVLLGSTAYDSVSNAPFWVTWQQELFIPREVTGTLGMLACLAIVGGAYWIAVRAAAALGEAEPNAWGRRPDLSGEFAHTLVPIAAGYMVAHYFTLLVLEGQRTVIRMADPLVNGSNWLGLGDRAVASSWVTEKLVANTQVTAIIVGHMLGVVLAHDRALRLFASSRRALLSQLPLLVLMVAYTAGGLLLLFST